jgi:hypothetical protein
LMLNKFESEKGWYPEPLEVSRDHAAGKGACDDISDRGQVPGAACRDKGLVRVDHLPAQPAAANRGSVRARMPPDYRGLAEENRGVDRKHPTAQRWNHTVGCWALTSAPFQ